MPGKRKDSMDIREILRRLRKGQSDRTVAKALDIDRKTVRRYHSWAAEQGLLEGLLPPLSELHQSVKETLNNALPPQNVSSVEPYRELVEKLRRNGVEIAAVHERLKERDYTGSYASVYRFVRNLEPLTPEVTVRVETRPGEEAQVDFGYAGRMIDPDTGELRKTWAFVMTLSWSRHQYVEFVPSTRSGQASTRRSRPGFAATAMHLPSSAACRSGCGSTISRRASFVAAGTNRRLSKPTASAPSTMTF
jgi:transposase